MTNPRARPSFFGRSRANHGVAEVDGIATVMVAGIVAEVLGKGDPPICWLTSS
jgi:hypothetical protein